MTGRLALLHCGLWPNVIHKLREQPLPPKVKYFHSGSPVCLILLQGVHEEANDAGEGESSSNIQEEQQTTIDGHNVNTTNDDTAQPDNAPGSDNESESDEHELPGE